MRYPYRTEPLRPALIMIAVVLVAALLAPNNNLRILILVMLSGPLVWSAFQLLRRGRGVIVGDNQLELQSGVLRRSAVIPREHVQVHAIISRDRLALAYLQPRRAAPGDDPRPPRLRLYITASLADPSALAAGLPAANGLTPSQLNAIIVWRRIRRLLYLFFGLFIGVPAFVIVAARLLTAIFGLWSGY